LFFDTKKEQRSELFSYICTVKAALFSLFRQKVAKKGAHSRCRQPWVWRFKSSNIKLKIKKGNFQNQKQD